MYFYDFSYSKKVSFVYQTKETFLRDAFLAERDAHDLRDADFVCDARLRRVYGTHRITHHSAAASQGLADQPLSLPLRQSRQAAAHKGRAADIPGEAAPGELRIFPGTACPKIPKIKSVG